MTTEAELEGLRELLSKAAQGEWQLIDGESVVTDYREEDGKRIANWIAEIDHQNQDDYEYGPDWSGSDSALANGLLIVAAVNALPGLLDSLQSTRAALERAEAAVASKEAEGRKAAAEVCRVKAHGWRNEANTLEPNTDEWRELIAKAEAGEELSAFLNKKAGSDVEGQ